MRCKIIIFLSCLLVSISANAQFFDSSTGLLSAPSADMNESGTFILTNNYMNRHMLPQNGWDYSTFGYGIDITFWSRLEIGYVCTLFWGDWSPKAQSPTGTYRQKIMKNQDRHFVGKLLALKEGEIWNWTPSIAFGASDPVTGTGGDYIGSGERIDSGNGYFNRYYAVATKHFQTRFGVFGAHLGYQLSRRTDWDRQGVIGGIDWAPVWTQNRWFNPKFIAEYDSHTVNLGFISSIWDDRFEGMFELSNFQWISFGLRYKLRLAGSEN